MILSFNFSSNQYLCNPISYFLQSYMKSVILLLLAYINDKNKLQRTWTPLHDLKLLCCSSSFVMTKRGGGLNSTERNTREGEAIPARCSLNFTLQIPNQFQFNFHR